MEESSLDGAVVQDVVCKALGEALLAKGPPLKEPPDKPHVPPPDLPPPDIPPLPDTLPDAGADAMIEKSAPLPADPAPADEFLGADLETINKSIFTT